MLLLYLRLPLQIKLYIKNLFTLDLKGALSNLQRQERRVRKLKVAGDVEVLLIMVSMVREIVVSELKGTEWN